jgi:hypothetical protein
VTPYSERSRTTAPPCEELMTRATILICLSLLLMGCDQSPRERFRVPTRPAPVPEPFPPRWPDPVVRTIEVGREVRGVFDGLAQAFEFTAPRSGRLVARLTWDAWSNGTILTLQMGDTEFVARPPQYSPLVGTWDVTAGQPCRLTIGPGGTDWVYNDLYVLTTAIE